MSERPGQAPEVHVTTTSEPKTLHSLNEARLRREVIAIRDEDGWHTLATAQSDGFVASCGGVIPPDAVEHVAEWGEIHDLGTNYCMECLALAEGEWTRTRFPNSLLHARRDERERRYAMWLRQTGMTTQQSPSTREYFLREQERGPKA